MYVCIDFCLVFSHQWLRHRRWQDCCNRVLYRTDVTAGFTTVSNVLFPVFGCLFHASSVVLYFAHICRQVLSGTEYTSREITMLREPSRYSSYNGSLHTIISTAITADWSTVASYGRGGRTGDNGVFGLLRLLRNAKSGSRDRFLSDLVLILQYFIYDFI